MGTCRGKDAKHRVSTGKIVQTIGKCIGIMGGRMPFAQAVIKVLMKKAMTMSQHKMVRNDGINALEIIEYAKYLGLDINTDQDLLWIAVEGLKAPVPEPWRAI